MMPLLITLETALIKFIWLASWLIIVIHTWISIRWQGIALALGEDLIASDALPEPAPNPERRMSTLGNCLVAPHSQAVPICSLCANRGNPIKSAS